MNIRSKSVKSGFLKLTGWQQSSHSWQGRPWFLCKKLYLNSEKSLESPGLVWHDVTVDSLVLTLSIISRTRLFVSREGIVNLSRTSHLAKIRTIRLNFLEKSIIIKTFSLTSPFRQVELSLDQTGLDICWEGSEEDNKRFGLTSAR